MYTNQQIEQSIDFMKNWTTNSLKEIKGDVESDYAKWVLENNKQIAVAINIMKDTLLERNTTCCPTPYEYETFAYTE